MDEEVRQEYLSCVRAGRVSQPLLEMEGTIFTLMHAYGVMIQYFLGGERIMASYMGSAAADLMV